jgi:hypothetical protein
VKRSLLAIILLFIKEIQQIFPRHSNGLDQ